MELTKLPFIKMITVNYSQEFLSKGVVLLLAISEPTHAEVRGQEVSL